MIRLFLLTLLLWCLPAWAAPGTEFVLVIDNSGSMITNVRTPAGVIPPADPQRQAILGALVIEGLTRDSDDQLTVLSFDRGAADDTQVVVGAQAIRQLDDGGGTFYLGPLARARRILEDSPRTDRVLVFLSDGAPNDYTDPLRGPSTLGLQREVVPFDTVIIGLLPEGPFADKARSFMKPLALEEADYVEVSQAPDLVQHFTRAYARSLGSKALTGTLGQGQSRSFEVGRYVTEIMVITASATPTGPFEASLTGPDGPASSRAQGDNGCDLDFANAPGLCDPPRSHYTVWRVPHDPQARDTWTLTIDRSRGDVVYGVILRYDLGARIAVDGPVRVSDEVPVRAELTWQGRTFDDAEFFQADGFEASASIGGDEVVLTPGEDGVFTGTWVPTTASSGAPFPAQVSFRNAWMEERASTSVLVEGFLELDLRPHPTPLDFGSWRAERRQTSRCLELDLRSSLHADRIPLDIQFEGTESLGQAVLTLTPLDAGAARGPSPLRWEACVVVPGCCGDIASPAEAAVLIRGQHPYYHPDAVRVPVVFEVQRTGFLRCWWPWLLLLAGIAFLIWVIVGFVRPHDFPDDMTVKVAGSERQLRRAASLVLREQPRGRRGFYRNARISITSAGDFVSSPRRASLVVEATSSAGDTVLHLKGPLERKDRRTRKWMPVQADEAIDGVRSQEIYRVGETYLLFG